MGNPATDDSVTIAFPSYHWTTARARAFLGALAEYGMVSRAAKAVGMTRQSAYRLRKRLGEGSRFALVWDIALVEAHERKRRQAAAPKVTPLPPESDIFGLER